MPLSAFKALWSTIVHSKSSCTFGKLFCISEGDYSSEGIYLGKALTKYTLVKDQSAKYETVEFEKHDERCDMQHRRHCL